MSIYRNFTLLKVKQISNRDLYIDICIIVFSGGTKCIQNHISNKINPFKEIWITFSYSLFFAASVMDFCRNRKLFQVFELIISEYRKSYWGPINALSMSCDANNWVLLQALPYGICFERMKYTSWVIVQKTSPSLLYRENHLNVVNIH